MRSTIQKLVEESDDDDDSKLKFIHIMIIHRTMTLNKNKIITNQIINKSVEKYFL